MRRLWGRRPRLSDEGGFTLVELLMASSIGLLILGSAGFITVGAARHNGEIANRTDATQRGRLALERTIRLLRSQVCTTYSAYPVSSASATQVVFTADLSDGSKTPVQHTITYSTATKTLSDKAISGSTATPITFPGTGATDTIADNIVTDATGAVFRYYAYPTTPTAGVALEPTVELVPPTGGVLPAASLAKISRVDVSFLATGATKATQNIKAEMQDRVFVRISDPNQPAAFDPSCS